jgi:acetyl-CoA C-acetyltransferase
VKRDETPVLVGTAQTTQRADGNAIGVDPLSLMAATSAAALADAGSARLLERIDRIDVVNIISWQYADAPGELAQRLGARPVETRYTTIGGNTPQTLVHEAAIALAQGRCRAVLIAGAEAGASAARVRKRGDATTSWPARARPTAEHGDPRVGANETEQAYGLLLPSLMYPLIETAIRAAEGRAPLVHQSRLGQLFARFAAVAAENPRAWFRTAHSAEEISTPSAENRYVGYPYTKRMNAIMAVDQAAAVVLTTEAEADDLGISRELRVYPMGGGELNDVWSVTDRPTLHRSPAIRQAARAALDQAGVALEDIAAFDLYSCFPAAVELAMNALDLSMEDERPLTITGGLPYFGGPGNNYSLHAIASAAETIRADRHATVLVSALGWYCTKHAIGIYGPRPPRSPWQDVTNRAHQATIDREARQPVVTMAQGPGRVAAFVVRHERDGAPVEATVLVDLPDRHRALARLDVEPHELGLLEEEEIVGRSGSIRYVTAEHRNRFRIS